MKFQTSLVIALVGAAATMASAQKLGPAVVRHELAGRMSINLGDANTGRTLSNVLVYDNWEEDDATVGLSTLFTGTGILGSADNLALQLPRTGAGIFGPIASTLTRMSFIIATDTGDDNSAFFFFSSGARSWSSQDLPGDLGGYGVNITGYSGAGAYVLELTGLEGLTTPIAFTETNCAVEGYGADATGNYPDLTGNSAIVNNGDNSASGEDGGPTTGWSDDYQWLDIDQNGFCNSGTESFYYYGGTPFVANMAIAMDVLFCDTDFDGSGFQDFDDFNAYVASFEVGC